MNGNQAATWTARDTWGWGIRGSNDDRWDSVDVERDPYRDLKDGFEDLPDPMNDEYIWPSTGEDEDD